MKIIPQGFRMLVRLNKVEEYAHKFKNEDGSEGQIIMPDKHAELTRIGIVEEVGEKVRGWKKGDLFLCDFSAGSVVDSPKLAALKPSQDTLRIIVQEDIWAKVIEEEEDG